jgi:hypothetical protein
MQQPLSFIYLNSFLQFHCFVKIRVLHHGIPKTIISDMGSIFVARFWE